MQPRERRQGEPSIRGGALAKEGMLRKEIMLPTVALVERKLGVLTDLRANRGGCEIVVRHHRRFVPTATLGARGVAMADAMKAEEAHRTAHVLAEHGVDGDDAR